jgi:peptide chain release factor 1
MALIEKLRKIKERFDFINKELSEPAYSKEKDKIISLSRERSELIEIIDKYEEYSKVLKNIEGNKEIIHSGLDKELEELAEMEMKDLEEKKEKLEEEIKLLLLPKDPNDTKDVIMEIRAGTGGEEAALFAADLFRMYSRYGEVKGWKVELVDINDTGLGGIKGFTNGDSFRRIKI